MTSPISGGTVTISVDNKSLDSLVASVRSAQQAYSSYSQKQVDHIFKQTALAANNARIRLERPPNDVNRFGIRESAEI